MSLALSLLFSTLAIALAAGFLVLRRFDLFRFGPARGMPRRGAVFVKNPEVVTSLRDGELVLRFPRQTEGLSLNAVAARCWELMDGSARLGSIAEKLAAEHGVTRNDALHEVLDLAQRLRREYYAMEDREWQLAHTHANDLFAGARDEGVREIRLGESLILHAAVEALEPGGLLRTPQPLWASWPFRRRRALESFSRHMKREEPLHLALEAHRQARAHSAAGDLDQAEQRFREAIRLAPGWASAHYQLGCIHMRCRRYDEALVQFDQTERISPGHLMVREYLDLARKLAEGQVRFEAFHLFEKAAASPDDPDGVIALCRKALELSPDFPSARLVLGRAYARKRDYDRAMAELRGAIDSGPDRSTLCNALYTRGYIFMARGMAEQGLREFEKVIELNGSPAATRSAISAMAHLASADRVN